MISPRQKAKELIETFTYNCRECDNAKLSALFAVDEILKVSVSYAGKDYDFYQEVKNELLKSE